MSEGPLYHKMRGVSSALLSPAKAYLADDHLLLVQESMTAQEYRRFYFRDIQAVIVRKTAGGSILIILYSILLVVFLVSFLSVYVDTGGITGPRIINPVSLATVGLAAALLALLIINIVKGPTVICCLQTAANVQKVPMIKRLNHARRFIEQLRGPIEQIQGPLVLPAVPPWPQGEPPPLPIEAAPTLPAEAAPTPPAEAAPPPTPPAATEAP